MENVPSASSNNDLAKTDDSSSFKEGSNENSISSRVELINGNRITSTTTIVTTTTIITFIHSLFYLQFYFFESKNLDQKCQHHYTDWGKQQQQQPQLGLFRCGER